MKALLHPLIVRFITTGTLRVVWPDGSTGRYGTGQAPCVAARLASNAAIRRMLTDPTLALGELYMDGGIQLLDGTSAYNLLDLMAANLRANGRGNPGIALAIAWGWLRRRLDQYNPDQRARRNVAHHYDLDERLYALFLDADRQYSCAYFPTGDESLEQAQAAKKRHIAGKLLLDRPGLRVLDIGSGWGGLALTLAADYGCAVEGITLSREQLAVSQRRAEAAGLAGRVRFALLDYRHLSERYDRIVSVGMFEHVGVGQYGAYFGAIARCLAPDGVALLHTIGRSDGPHSTNRWLAKYIFPGGYSPALSEIIPAIERGGLVLTDVEVLRLHYARTLRCWRERFAARRATIAGLYDERFCRMFEFYLALSEVAFRRLTHVNFQLQMTHGITATPLTRDYMHEAELGSG